MPERRLVVVVLGVLLLAVLWWTLPAGPEDPSADWTGLLLVRVELIPPWVYLVSFVILPAYRIPCFRPGDEWKVILMVRASPLPRLIQNYLLTLGGARFIPYMLFEIPVQALIGLGVILLGDAILSGDLRWALIGLFLVAAVWVALRVMRRRGIAKTP